MIPQLVATGYSALVGDGTENVNWNMTIPNLGPNGLIVFGWIAKEEDGETNPEELNVASFNGLAMTLKTANRNETGAGLCYRTGADLPGAGTYTCNLNFKDSPRYADKKRGISAAFTNVKRQAAEATAAITGPGSPMATTITPLTANALVVATWGWRVGFAETWAWGTPIITNRGDNATGTSMTYAIVSTPALQTVSVSANNPEDNGLAIASFAMQSPKPGQIL